MYTNTVKSIISLIRLNSGVHVHTILYVFLSFLADNFMDIRRVQWALNHVLIQYTITSPTTIDPDDFEDVIEFLTDECRQSGINLDTYLGPTTTGDGEKVEDESDSSVASTRTLEELDNHPLTNLIHHHLVTLLEIHSDQVPLVIDEVLDAYQRGPPQGDDNLEESLEVLGSNVCELCERPVALTEHHLIPRTEHALMIKRGIHTQIECKLFYAHIHPSLGMQIH